MRPKNAAAIFRSMASEVNARSGMMHHPRPGFYFSDRIMGTIRFRKENAFRNILPFNASQGKGFSGIDSLDGGGFSPADMKTFPKPVLCEAG
jgi:hypothetical protein